MASNYSGLLLDSATIAPDGSFVFEKLNLKEFPVLIQLCVQKNHSRFANQLLDDDPGAANYMPVVLNSNEPIVIAAAIERFQADFSITNPTPDNQALLRLRDLRHEAFTQYLAPLLSETHAPDSSLLEREKSLHAFQRVLMGFADSATTLLPALIALRWVSPNGDYERIPEFPVRQCERWTRLAPNHPFTAQLCRTADRSRLPTLEGDQIPDYLFPMNTGDTLPLYSLLGKSVTILDIWASWCAPCRRENRTALAPLYTEYQSRGLQIIGYSIDSNPKAWKEALEKDGATWPQASHLQGDAAPFLEALRMTTIPANFILDPSGKIIAKNLHGEDLTDFVKSRLR